jgi:hypothetical protein
VRIERAPLQPEIGHRLGVGVSPLFSHGRPFTRKEGFRGRRDRRRRDVAATRSTDGGAVGTRRCLGRRNIGLRVTLMGAFLSRSGREQAAARYAGLEVQGCAEAPAQAKRPPPASKTPCGSDTTPQERASCAAVRGETPPAPASATL